VLEAVQRGAFASKGFRKRDLRGLWCPKPPHHDADDRRHAAALTRPLRWRRAPGLIHQLSQTHRSPRSPHGREVSNALRAARQASTAT
jgi:hypothetical protein